MKLVELFESLNARSITDPRGVGSVPLNLEIDQMGIRVKMTPSEFMTLATPLLNPRSEHIEYIKTQLNNNTPIAPPSFVLNFLLNGTTNSFSIEKTIFRLLR